LTGVKGTKKEGLKKAMPIAPEKCTSTAKKIAQWKGLFIQYGVWVLMQGSQLNRSQ
jgi:hypothetical protein